MILQKLADFYDRTVQDPKAGVALPKPGYSVQRISFCVVLSPEGKFQGFQSMLDEVGKNLVPRQMLVPGQSKPPGSGLNPCFLWDNAAYMLGFKKDDPKPERTREAFEKYRARHLDAKDEVTGPAFTAVCNFLTEWSPERTTEYAAQLTKLSTHFGVFKIAGVQGYVHDDAGVISYWANHNQTVAVDSTEQREVMCLVSGTAGPVATIHEPKIKGVADAQSSGALLVSFNSDAYESLGKKQGDNAPVSVSATFRYANALNYLLNNRHRRIQLGDATVVFWADRPTLLEDAGEIIFGDAPVPKPDAPVEDISRAQEVKVFLTQLRDGHANATAIAADGEVGFYILGLSPNASRISIRFWVPSTVGEMQARLAQHLRDTELIGARPEDPPIVIRRIVQATGRAEFTGGSFKGYDSASAPPMLAGAVARAILQGTSYPSMLLGQMLNRIRADGHVSHVRVATIKACIVRNSRVSSNPMEVPVALDTDRIDPAYVTGRLFALLEKIQSDSLPNLNSTIKDRYFSAASATPASVFSRLIRLSQHHLSNLETGQKIYYERLVGEVMNKLTSFASHFSLQDQGLFAIGYFHQRQDLFTSKKPKEGEK